MPITVMWPKLNHIWCHRRCRQTYNNRKSKKKILWPLLLFADECCSSIFILAKKNSVICCLWFYAFSVWGHARIVLYLTGIFNLQIHLMNFLSRSILRIITPQVLDGYDIWGPRPFQFKIYINFNKIYLLTWVLIRFENWPSLIIFGVFIGNVFLTWLIKK